jgi:hypothetical protein
MLGWLEAAQTSGTSHPFILQVPVDRYATAVQAAQALLLLAQTILLAIIAVWTFRSGSEQKLRERRAAWYQKIVADHALPLLGTFFRDVNIRLGKAAEECVSLRQQARTIELEKLVKTSVADFKQELYRVQGEVFDRAAVFDSELRDSVCSTLDELEEVVSDWFDIHAFSRNRQNKKELAEVLATSHTQLLKILYDYEFSRFG